MAKAIIKEFIVVLLLVLAIVLILGIFLYEYIPTNKIVPKIEQYQVPNSIKEELDSTITDLEQEKTKIVYEIDGTDLNNYEKTKDYQKGKVNPFAQELTPTEGNGENSNANNTNTNNNNNTSSNTTNNNTTNTTDTTNNSNSVGNYLPNTGTK